ELSVIQLSMSIVEFALYRAFIELGPFLIAAQLILLRAPTDMSVQLRAWARVGLGLTTVLFLGYAIVNSRLYAIIALAIPYGIVNATSRPDRRLGLGMVAGTLMIAMGGLYVIRVVENVRLSIAGGEGVFALE